MNHSYLIVVDMQNDFITGTLGTPEAQKILGEVVRKVENFPGQVIFTQDTHGADYLSTQEGKMLPAEHCISGNGRMGAGSSAGKDPAGAGAFCLPERYVRVSGSGPGFVRREPEKSHRQHRADRAVYRYLRGVKRVGFEGVSAGGAGFCGCRMLCRSCSGEP